MIFRHWFNSRPEYADRIPHFFTRGEMEDCWHNATAVQREPMECGHPVAVSVLIHEETTNIQEVRVCAWCETLEQERVYATAAERERCIARCHKLKNRYRNPERKHIVQRCMDYIGEADDDI